MNKELYKRLKEYLNINGISRHEEAVVDKLKENIDENIIYKRDGLGSIIFSLKNKKENGLKIAVVAHMDEVGFLVQDILKNGQLILAMVGGVWPNVIIGTKAIVE
ncbi:MAG: M42 family peptidase, partial [Metamycoplasmataceae bacterium]